MWSSEQESYTSNPNPNLNVSSSSRSSLSSDTSIIFPQIPRRSMEDVWKDISLMTPLQNHRHQQPNFQKHHQKPNHFHDTNPNSIKGMILQDFLAGPMNQPPETTLPTIQPQNPPQTVLSLNSLEFNCLQNGPSSNNSSSGDSARVNVRVTDQTSYMSSAFPELIVGPASPGNILSFCPKNRVLPEARTGTGDRRHKRMIKNRESAARSRARKQAYTNELELEVAHLMEENVKLKKQQEELRVAMAAQVPTRSSLQRSSSSPF